MIYREIRCVSPAGGPVNKCLPRSHDHPRPQAPQYLYLEEQPLTPKNTHANSHLKSSDQYMPNVNQHLNHNASEFLHRRLESSEIHDADDIDAYFHQRFGTAYNGYAAVLVIGTRMRWLETILTKMLETDPEAFHQLWIAQTPAGNYSVTTHIETDNPGQSACIFINAHASTTAEHQFGIHLQAVVCALQADRRRWVAAGYPIYPLRRLAHRIQQTHGIN